MATISQFARDTYPALRKVIFNSFDREKLVYPSIVNVNSTDRWYEEDNTEVGYGLFASTGDGENYSQDEMQDGYYTRYQLSKYTKFFRVTEDLIEFGKYVTMNRRANDLGDKARITMDTLAHSVYNLGGTTNLADGVPLFSASHPGYPGSGTTFSNIAATQSALSFTSFQADLTAIMTQVDERGTLINLRPRKLVVHPSQGVTALELRNSMDRPDTANRSSNELKNFGGSFDVVIDPYLTSTTMWFIICDTFHVNVFTHGGLRTRTYEDPYNGDQLVFGKFYLSYGASHALGVYAGSL